MAILSDYTAGTVTVGAGGTAVTGVGTAWLTAGFQEGDIFIAADWYSVVASVNSNTSLTLYPVGRRGAALSAAPYRLRYMSDGSRSTAQARELINLLGGSGNLQAIGGLTSAPNTMPYFTGAGTAAVTPLTAFGRSLLDDANAAAARTTLDLIKQSSIADVTAGRLMTTGAFGLGASGSTINSPTGPTGISDLAASTFFTHSTGSAPGDAPIATQGAGVKVGGGNAFQATLWAGLSGASAQNRWFGRVAGSSGGNSPWVEFLTTSNAGTGIDLMGLSVVT